MIYRAVTKNVTNVLNFDYLSKLGWESHESGENKKKKATDPKYIHLAKPMSTNW